MEAFDNAVRFQGGETEGRKDRGWVIAVSHLIFRHVQRVDANAVLIYVLQAVQPFAVDSFFFGLLFRMCAGKAG